MDAQCLTCEDYVDRWLYAKVLHGKWDYIICKKTCWQDEDKHSAYQRKWAREKAGVR